MTEAFEHLSGTRSAMRTDLEPAEVYRREAVRLRMMAEGQDYQMVRDGLLDMARQYNVMAAQTESIQQHTFGQPFGRRPQHRGR